MPALFNMDDACRALGNIGHERVRKYIKAGWLVAVRDGARTFITAESLYALPDKLIANGQRVPVD